MIIISLKVRSSGIIIINGNIDGHLSFIFSAVLMFVELNAIKNIFNTSCYELWLLPLVVLSSLWCFSYDEKGKKSKT